MPCGGEPTDGVQESCERRDVASRADLASGEATLETGGVPDIDEPDDMRSRCAGDRTGDDGCPTCRQPEDKPPFPTRVVSDDGRESRAIDARDESETPEPRRPLLRVSARTLLDEPDHCCRPSSAAGTKWREEAPRMKAIVGACGMN
eukprot:scaffold186516_cov28-Tisochrysis_lutea.AAC.1